MKRIRKLIELRKRDWEIIGIVFIGCKLTMYFREVLKEAKETGKEVRSKGDNRVS